MSRRPPFDLSLYLVTDPDMVRARGLTAVVAAAVRGGASLVQLRDKHAPTHELTEQATALKRLLAPLGVPLIINDRIDVAVAAGADGAHVGQEDMAPDEARRLLGPDRILGVSVSRPEEVATADPALVDYAGVGAVFPTATKEKIAPPLGLDGLAALRARIPLPVVAIGGIGEANTAGVIAAGADGIAVVSAICAAADPEAACRRLRREIERGLSRRKDCS